MLNVDRHRIVAQARRIVSLRRVANDDRRSPGERVRALSELAELASSVKERVRSAESFGGISARTSAAFESIVGVRPDQLDGDRVARRCIHLARETFAWGAYARRCVRKLDPWRADSRLVARLSYPSLPDTFFTTENADENVRLHARTAARLREHPGDATARIRLAAMQTAVGDASAALASLSPLANASQASAEAYKR